MSGASISATSIPDSALSTNVALLTGTQTFSGTKTYSAIINANAGITRATAQTVATANDYLTKSYQQNNNYCNDFNGIVSLNRQFPILFGYNTGTLGTSFYSQLDCDYINLSYNPSTGITTCYASSAIDVIGDGTYSVGSIPYKKTALTTGFTTAGTAGQYLVSQGTSAPTWNTLSVPDSALTSNVALLTGTQTFSGAKTFSTAPVMSGASISATSIPDSALSTNVVLKNANNIFTGSNDFNNSLNTKGALAVVNPIANAGYLRFVCDASKTYIQSGVNNTTSLTAPLIFTDVNNTTPWLTITSTGITAPNLITANGGITTSGFTNTAGVTDLNATTSGSNANQIRFISATSGTTYTIQQIDNGGANYFRLGRNGTDDITISSTGLVGINNNILKTTLIQLSYSGDTTLTAPFYQTYILNPSGSALTNDITFTIGTLAIPDGTIINFRKGTATTGSISLVMTGRSYVPYNTTSGIGGVLLTQNQQATSIIIVNGNAYQTYIGGSEIPDFISNNITVNNDFKVGLYNPTQYFTGSYSYSTNTNPLSATATTNFTYLLGTTSNTLVYTGARTLTLNYVVVGGGGNGGNGNSNTGGGGGSGGGGGAGQFVSGTTTVSTGQSIVLVIGSAGATSSLTIGGTLIVNAVGGNNGVSTGAGTAGANGGAGAGGIPAGGLGSSGAGGAGTATSLGASGGGGDGGGNTSTTNIGGVFSNVMNDLTTTVNIGNGGAGGRFNASAPIVNTSYYGSGGNGGGGKLSLGGFSGSSGVQGVIMLFFNTSIFEATTSGINTQVPITPIYTKIPSYTSNQIGYSVRNFLTSATLTGSWVSPTGGQITLASVGTYLLTYAFSVKNLNVVLMGCLSLSSTAPYSSPQTTDPATNTFAFCGSTNPNANWTSATNTYIYNNTSPNTIVYMYWSASGSAIPPANGNYFQAVRLA